MRKPRLPPSQTPKRKGQQELQTKPEKNKKIMPNQPGSIFDYLRAKSKAMKMAAAAIKRHLNAVQEKDEAKERWLRNLEARIAAIQFTVSMLVGAEGKTRSQKEEMEAVDLLG